MKKTLLLLSLAALLTAGSTMPTLAQERTTVMINLTEQDYEVMDQNIRDFVYAVEHAQSTKVRSLLQEGVNPNILLESGDTPLTHALRYDNWTMVDVLMASKLTDVTKENRMGETPLMLAVFKGREDYFDEMLKRGASVNKPSGWTALHYAATEGREDFVERLLKLGADVNAQTKTGVTPLHMAARLPDRACVMLLLRAGAYRDYCNQGGLSPSDMARRAGDAELADFLAIERCAVRGLKR